MTDISVLTEEVKRCVNIQDPLVRRLTVTAILTRALSPGPEPIVVGGLAVEFYSMGGYSTVDVDLVYADSARLNNTLQQLGFSQQGRHWFSSELNLSIEAPGSILEGD